MHGADSPPASNALPYERRPSPAAWTSEEDDILFELIHRDGKGYLCKTAAEEAQKMLRDRLGRVRSIEGILTRGRKLKRPRQSSVPPTAPPPAKRARLAQAVLPLESPAPATSEPKQLVDFSALPPTPWSDRDDDVLLAHWQAVIDGRMSWMDVCAVFPLQTHDQLLRRVQHLVQAVPKPAAGQLASSSVKPDSSTRPDLHKKPLPRPTTTSPPSATSLRYFREAIAALRGVSVAPSDAVRDEDQPQAGPPLQAVFRPPESSRSPSPESFEVSRVTSYEPNVAQALRRVFGQPRLQNFAHPLLSSPNLAISPAVTLRSQPLYAALAAAPVLSLPSSPFCHAPRSETDDYRIPTSADFLPVKPASIVDKSASQWTPRQS
ncbi:hypothetical protein NBRC10513_007052 [Rhodotorula toruloides]